MLDAVPPPAAEAQPTIIVTGRALPDAAAERAYSVDLIDGLRLANAPASRLDLILRQSAGLQLFRRSDSRSAHPTSQGVTLRGLGGNAASRAIVTLDGVPQADPFGGWINWPAYDAASLSSVRVVRGGGSVSNGPGALAGSIEMTSSLAEGLSASLEAGSHDFAAGRIRLGSPLAGGRVSASAHASRGDGFVPVTASTRGPADQRASFREAGGRLLWVAPVAASTEVQTSASGFTDRRTRGLSFTDNRTDGLEGSIRIVSRGPLPWSALAYGQWRQFESGFAGVNADRSFAQPTARQHKVPSHAVGGAVEIRPKLGAIDLRLGADTRASVGETRELFGYAAGRPTRRRLAGGRTWTAGAFAEATATLGKATFSSGGRLDRWEISNGKLAEWTIATGAVLRDQAFADRQGWLPTGRGSLRYRVSGDLSLRSAAYLGWRMPTLNELFRPFRAGPDATAANPLLDPERLSGAELGLHYDKGGLAFRATAFDNRVRDPIANVTLAAGPGVFPQVGFVGAGGEYRERRNLDRQRSRGVELSGELRRGPLSGWVSASVVAARVSDRDAGAQLDGLRPAQVPRFSGSAGLNWERKGRAISLAVRRVGDQFEDDLNRTALPGAATLDGFAALPLTARLQLFAKAENLFDKKVVAAINGDGSVERAQPRTMSIGLRLSP